MMEDFRRKALMVAQSLQQQLLQRRAGSFKRVLAPGGPLARDREIVLADLRDFCCGVTTTFADDALVMARKAGRREVWLRITRHLNLSEAEAQKLVEIDDGTGDFE